MASLSRDSLILVFKEYLSSCAAVRSLTPRDTTHIQMASVDEMMAAFGYLPKKVAYDVNDGRYGYVAIREDWGIPVLGRHISFENAVRMHNGHFEWMSKRKKSLIDTRLHFALRYRIVEVVALQRWKRGKGHTDLKSQISWVKFL